ncbi:MAG: high-potential iron-sulfur protein [Pseudomonadota bacterium]
MDDNNETNNRNRRRSRLSLFTRRRFVKSAGAATVAIGFGPSALADEELPRVNEDGPIAKALNYVHDARTVDAAKRFSDRYCNNCALYEGGTDDEWAKCSIFPGKVVAGAGWCSAWVAKADK